MTSGVVRGWHHDEGWGVLDSAETPGGCWAHFSALRMAGYAAAEAGQTVEFAYEEGSQDGYDYRALDVTIDGVPRVDPAPQPPGAGYRSRLNILFEEPQGPGPA